MLDFEWDDAKARANTRKHGITFERAKQAFSDPFAVAVLDDREDYGEERFLLLARGGGPLLFITYTERGDRVRIISARRATKHEQPSTSKRTKKPAGRARAMSEDEVMAAALSDPDAQPLRRADFARMKLVPRAKIVRRALGLSQEEFAARYHIPLGTLRDWEQGRSEPDQTARAYLEVIAAEPTNTAKALASHAA